MHNVARSTRGAGKERFVTAAYKRKLAEDKAFAARLAAQCGALFLLPYACSMFDKLLI